MGVVGTSRQVHELPEGPPDDLVAITEQADGLRVRGGDRTVEVDDGQGSRCGVEDGLEPVPLGLELAVGALAELVVALVHLVRGALQRSGEQVTVSVVVVIRRRH